MLGGDSYTVDSVADDIVDIEMNLAQVFNTHYVLQLYTGFQYHISCDI